MKKTAILGLSALLALGFTACDNYEEPNPAPQTNVQTSVLQVEDLLFETALGADAYNLTTLNDNYESILMATISTDALAQGYAFETVGELSTDNFAHAYTFTPTVTPDEENPSVYNIVATPDDIDAAYKNITRDPKQADLQIRYRLYTVYGSQKAIVGGPDKTFGPYEMKIIPVTPFAIEDTYYVYLTNGGKTDKIKFSHSDASPYDVPTFSIKLDLSAGMTWKVVAASNSSNGTPFFGVEPGNEEAATGKLYDSSADAGAAEGQILLSGPYLMTIDMEKMTYNFSLVIDQLYTPGNSNGWSQAASQMLTTADYLNYSGFVHLDGEFKFTSALDWGGINYGSNGTDGELTDDGGAGNLNISPNGLYYCTVNISEMTYSALPCTTIGIIGDATPGGWDSDTDLTPSADFLTWTATVALGEGGFKFRFNDDWALSLGGSTENLTTDGGNIDSPGKGTYQVTLDFSTVPYTAKFVKK